MSIKKLIEDPRLIKDEQTAITNGYDFIIATKLGKHQPWIAVHSHITPLRQAFELADKTLKNDDSNKTVAIFRDGFVYWTSTSPVVNSTILEANIMIKNIKSVSYSLCGDDGLAFVYFDFGEFNYFTVTFNLNEDKLPYFESNEQSYSITSWQVTYCIDSHADTLEFNFGARERQALGLPAVLVMSLKSISPHDIAKIIEVLDLILSYE